MLQRDLVRRLGGPTLHLQLVDRRDLARASPQEAMLPDRRVYRVPKTGSTPSRVGHDQRLESPAEGKQDLNRVRYSGTIFRKVLKDRQLELSQIAAFSTGAALEASNIFWMLQFA